MNMEQGKRQKTTMFVQFSQKIVGQISIAIGCNQQQITQESKNDTYMFR